jgi:hypothetical protein
MSGRILAYWIGYRPSQAADSREAYRARCRVGKGSAGKNQDYEELAAITEQRKSRKTKNTFQEYPARMRPVQIP